MWGVVFAACPGLPFPFLPSSLPCNCLFFLILPSSVTACLFFFFLPLCRVMLCCKARTWVATTTYIWCIYIRYFWHGNHQVNDVPVCKRVWPTLHIPYNPAQHCGIVVEMFAPNIYLFTYSYI